jgi:hypothetical protein
MLSNRNPALTDLIPGHIRSSPLLQQGGFDVFEGLLNGDSYQLMLAEALNLAKTAQPSEVSTPDLEERRGGVPPRRFLNAAGGSIQDAFYTAPWMIDFLRQVTGVPVTPTGVRGTYTYYARPGDYLALHRDIETCDLAVITCLYDNSSWSGYAGTLCLYPERLLEPLSAIRASLDQGVIRLRLKPRQTLVMWGGIVPHAVLPMAHHQVRIVSALCYRA